MLNLTIEKSVVLKCFQCDNHLRRDVPLSFSRGTVDTMMRKAAEVRDWKVHDHIALCPVCETQRQADVADKKF